MLKVFSSGSCRLLTAINDGRGKIEPVHSMFHNFAGINFLGKLHNTKQHIQFIKWLNDEIDIPQHILKSFLTSYSKLDGIEDERIIPSKKENIRAAFKECECFIFEICSMKLYEKDGYQVQFELTTDYACNLQSEADLYDDLRVLRGLIPEGKRVIFQIHFRPNIIYNRRSNAIKKREMIYGAVNGFCNLAKNTYLYDPSLVLKGDTSLFDGDTHFTSAGYEKSFEYLYGLVHRDA